MFESYTFYGLLCKNHVKSLQNRLKFRIFVGRKDQKTMKITINMTHKSKTSCFTVDKIALTMRKDGFDKVKQVVLPIEAAV